MIAVETFAGSGGMMLGLDKAGFETRFAVEMLPAACQTLDYNRNGGEAAHGVTVLNSRVESVDWDACKAHLGEIDLLAGGPPCQPYSNSGLHKGQADSRDGFPHFLKVLSALQPRAFLVENVKGLLTAPHSDYFSKIIADLSAQGYSVQFKILNAADFGVPQIRNRVFIVGVRQPCPAFQWPEPTHSAAALLKTWDKSAADYDMLRKAAKHSSNAAKLPWVTVRDVLSAPCAEGTANTESRNPTPSELRPEWLKKHPACRLDLPAPTIRARKNGESPLVSFPEGSPLRRLTPRECARIQGYPDNYAFRGRFGETVLQIGNSAPPLLVAAVARQIHKALAAESEE